MPAEIQVVSRAWEGSNNQPYLVYLPEKDRLLMLLRTDKRGSTLIRSDDHGQTWSPRQWLKAEGADPTNVRVSALSYLGQGRLLATGSQALWASDDFGETWTVRPLEASSLLRSAWDPFLVVRDATGGVERLVLSFYRSTGEPWGTKEHPSSQAGLLFGDGQGQNWQSPRDVPQWGGVNEVNLLIAQNGDWVAACRTNCPERLAHVAIGRRQPGQENFDFDNPRHMEAHFATFQRRSGAAHWDHYCGLGVSISRDQGRTWSEVKPLFEWGRHHPSMALLPDGRIVMSYVVRLGYPDTADGFPQFGVEAVVSRDQGQTWELEHRYVLARWVGNLQGEQAYFCGVQSTSTVALPDGRLLTAFGTGHQTTGPQRRNDTALVRWQLAE